MTGRLPYHNKGKREAIEHAIRQGELPDDIVSLAAPEFVTSILENCWQQDPSSRQEIGRCFEQIPARSSHPRPLPTVSLTGLDHDLLWKNTVSVTTE